ncbi:MAG: tRNA (N6-threonylcarbamoyladenosine(37)-N6)-methyltransferase TrmO [Actinomycetota bacterium]
MGRPEGLRLEPIGLVQSPITDRASAPKQGREGAPGARLVIGREYAAGLAGVEAGSEMLVFTWLHLADRSTLQVHPRGDPDAPTRGVFTTRSPDRPNPIGIHRVRVTSVSGTELSVTDMEAVDGTPVIDLKPVRDEGC